MSDTQKQHAIQWLDEIKEKLRFLEKVRNDEALVLSPNFLALDFLRKNENGISAIIAFLLDPKETHGQGKLFLKTFLELFWKEINTSNLSSAKVKTEALTYRINRSYRRMDILVEIGDLSSEGVFAIENKVWRAQDQKEQAADYLEYLKKSNPDKHRLFFLTASGSIFPSANSIEKVALDLNLQSGRMIPLGFEDIANWLRICQSGCQSDRVRAFLEEIILFIIKRVLKDINEKDESMIVEHATSSRENLNSALSIIKSSIAIKDKALAVFKKQIIKIADEEIPGFDLNFNENFDKKCKCASIYIRPSPLYIISFELSKNNLLDAAAGVFIESQANYMYKTSIGPELKRLLNNEGEPLDEKTGWAWCAKPHHDIPDDWQTDSAILSMVDGELAKNVVAELKMILSKLKEANLPEELVPTKMPSPCV